MKTILNAAPARAFATSLPGFVDVLVVNAIEAEMLGGGRVSSLETAATPPRRSPGLQGGVVTRAATASPTAAKAVERIESAGLPVTVASTHGAGDTFVGTLAARLASGDTMRAALTAANREAARLVSTPESERTF